MAGDYEAAVRRVFEEEPHDPMCGGAAPEDNHCTCDREARIIAKLARGNEAATRAVYSPYFTEQAADEKACRAFEEATK